MGGHRRGRQPGEGPRPQGCSRPRDPPNLGEILARYPRVVVPELNLGQLSKLLRAEYLVDAHSITKVQGVPFTAGELEVAFLKELGA